MFQIHSHAWPRPASRLVLIIAVVCGLAGSGHAVIRYVNKNAAGVAHDGSSWATAFTTVQAGVNAAAPGDEVWVAVSKPAADAYVENVTLTNGVALYGGFNGSEAQRSQRNWKANVTVLDGNASNTVVTIPHAVTQPATVDGFTIRHGMTHGGSAGGGIYVFGKAAITNNIITSNITSSSTYSGGGIGVQGTATITNNTITGNMGSHYLNGNSGGIFVGGTATITNNSITRNGGYIGALLVVSNFGGGVATLTNNIVAFNSSGMYNATGSTLTLSNNDVYGNEVYDYIGITDPKGKNGNIAADPKLSSTYANIHLEPGSPCIDAGDDAAVTSGGTDIDGQPRIQGAHVDIGSDEFDGSETPPYVPVVYHVSTNGSDANDGLTWATPKQTVGGALAAAQSGDEVWVSKGVYVENLAINTTGVGLYGGFSGSEASWSQRDASNNPTILDGGKKTGVVAVYFLDAVIDGFTIQNGLFGGIFVDGAAVITNNVITGNGNNTNNSGGGISVSGTAFIANNAITGNSSGSVFSGGGIDVDGTAVITNNTITGNSSGYGGGIEVDGGTAAITNNIVAFNSSGVRKDFGATLSLSHNDVYGNTAYNYYGLTDPTGANGNISLDPRFADLSIKDFHLQTVSPCINAGDDTAVTAGEADLDGNPRLLRTHVDMGAYEYSGGAAPFTLADAARALYISAGLSIGSPADLSRLNVEPGGPAQVIDALDAVRIARKIAGIDPNL